MDDPGAEDRSAGTAKGEGAPRPPWQRFLDLALARGHVLKTKGDGWKIFCERMNVPPFAYWDFLPGFHRLKRALDAAQEAAFVPEGFVRWLNEIRPAGAPEQTAAPVSPEEFADALETFFRQRVEWWGGPAGE